MCGMQTAWRFFATPYANDRCEFVVLGFGEPRTKLAKTQSL